MGAQSRLNLLVTHEERPAAGAERVPPWYQTLTHLLAPLGVQTFEATNGPQAVSLIEQQPIHLAVVDTRLPAIGGMNVLQLIQRIRDRAMRPDYAPGMQDDTKRTQVIRVQMELEQRDEAGKVQRRIEVHFDPSPAKPPVYPAVILITPRPTDQIMQEALKFDAFSVLSEPVDLNLMLEMLARALKRFHENRWPQ